MPRAARASTKRPGAKGRPAHAGAGARTAPVAFIPRVELPMLDPEWAARRIQRVLVRLSKRSRSSEMLAMQCPIDAVASAIHLHCVGFHSATDILAVMCDRLVPRDSGKPITHKSLYAFLRKAKDAYDAELHAELEQAKADAELGAAGDLAEVANIGITTLGRETIKLLQGGAFAEMDNTERNLIVRSIITLSEASRTVADARLKAAQTEQINRKLLELVNEAERSGSGNVPAAVLRREVLDTILVGTLGPEAAQRLLSQGGGEP
ncbi:MAG: hypothetical protein H6826_14380 [Planctomycetes bacterium]|nr:hypothetical protein [Planctomycetota bacterium]